MRCGVAASNGELAVKFGVRRTSVNGLRTTQCSKVANGIAQTIREHKTHSTTRRDHHARRANTRSRMRSRSVEFQKMKAAVQGSAGSGRRRSAVLMNAKPECIMDLRTWLFFFKNCNSPEDKREAAEKRLALVKEMRSRAYWLDSSRAQDALQGRRSSSSHVAGQSFASSQSSSSQAR